MSEDNPSFKVKYFLHRILIIFRIIVRNKLVLTDILIADISSLIFRK
jgi:hypothetical protein